MRKINHVLGSLSLGKMEGLLPPFWPLCDMVFAMVLFFTC